MIELCEVQYFLTDEFIGETEIVGVTSGDIYEDGRALATYMAAWYPTSLRELVMRVTIGEARGGIWRPTLSIAIRCPVGDASCFRIVSPEEQPWDDDLDECLRPEQIPASASALRAVELVPHILREDPSLARYLASTAPIPVDPAEIHREGRGPKPMPEDPEPYEVAPPSTLSLNELVRKFDERMKPWRMKKVAQPTAASIQRICRDLAIALPDSMVEFARRSECFGAWFAGLGEDYDNGLHILQLNARFHDASQEGVAMPPHLIMINHGHDEDCYCFDLRRERRAGEYSIRHWSPGGGSWSLYPSFLAYVEDLVRETK